MKLALVGDGSCDTIVQDITIPPLGLAYIAATALRDGHDVTIYPTSRYPSVAHLIDEINEKGAEVVGFPIKPEGVSQVIEIAQQLKSKSKTTVIVLIGTRASSVFEESLHNELFDYAVTGEAEITIPKLMNFIEGKGEFASIGGLISRQKGLVTVKDCMEELDELPLPARHLLPPPLSYTSPMLNYRALPVVHIHSSRSCATPNQMCEACKERPVRYRCATAVIKEVKEVTSRLGGREIRFVDEAFAYDGLRLADICEGFKSLHQPLPWVCRVKGGKISKKNLSMMRSAGCWQVVFSHLEQDLDEASVEAIHWAADEGLNVRCDVFARDELHLTCVISVLNKLPVQVIHVLDSGLQPMEEGKALGRFFFRPTFVFSKFIRAGSFCELQSTTVQYMTLVYNLWSKSIQNLALNLLLATLSLILCLMTLEIGLRKYCPQYRAAAESSLEEDAYRIWRPPVNNTGWDFRPDTNSRHWVIHNSLGLRQHREFSQDALAQRTTIALFGDSFIENRRVKTQHTLNEILDFLLNSVRDEYDVLNFGVEGYGLDQAYIHYLHSPVAKRANHVIYFFCRNDLRNVYENDLFSLDWNGELKQRPARYSPWWSRVATRMYTTYFVLDKLARIFPKADWAIYDRNLASRGFERTWRDWQHIYAWNTKEADRASEPKNKISQAATVFRAILRAFRQEVQKNKGTFTVILLAFPDEHAFRDLFPRNCRVIDLYELASSLTGNTDERRWKFKSDEHYNEEGNLVSAVCLFNELCPILKLKRRSREWVEKRIFVWYSAFSKDWQPTILSREAPLDDGELDRIRRKYLDLEPPGEVVGKRVYPPDYEIRCRVPDQSKN